MTHGCVAGDGQGINVSGNPALLMGHPMSGGIDRVAQESLQAPQISRLAGIENARQDVFAAGYLGIRKGLLAEQGPPLQVEEVECQARRSQVDGQPEYRPLLDPGVDVDHLPVTGMISQDRRNPVIPPADLPHCVVEAGRMNP